MRCCCIIWTLFVRFKRSIDKKTFSNCEKGTLASWRSRVRFRCSLVDCLQTDRNKKKGTAVPLVIDCRIHFTLQFLEKLGTRWQIRHILCDYRQNNGKKTIDLFWTAMKKIWYANVSELQHVFGCIAATSDALLERFSEIFAEHISMKITDDYF